jgi:uracil-DNA glycosylase
MPETIETLIEAVRSEAMRADFPVDAEVYQRSGRDPNVPILCAGTFEAPLCIVGRDLGKDEVRAGQPLIGAAGRSVRAGIIRARNQSRVADQDRPPENSVLADALEHALLTNLVPYKPGGNKAYSEDVRRRFRPFLERLLVDHWRGHQVITLGREAFEWFKPYSDLVVFQTDGRTETRFERVFACKLPVHNQSGLGREKTVLVYPLPHPSPLNRRWFSRFPSMLEERLAEVWSQAH